MKTTLTLALATALLTVGAFGGPGFVDRPRPTTPRMMAPAPHHRVTCKTMTITTNPKTATPTTVLCDAFARVRSAECRLACR